MNVCSSKPVHEFLLHCSIVVDGRNLFNTVCCGLFRQCQTTNSVLYDGRSFRIFLFLILQEKFKTGLLAESEEFKKSVANLLDDFHTNGPFSSSIATVDALSNIETIKASMQALKEKEATLRRGLGIFKIDQPPSKEIARLEAVSVHR